MKRNRKGPKDRHNDECRPSRPLAGIKGAPATPTLRPSLIPIGPPGLSRRELVLLSAVLSIGVLLRLIALSRSAVEHFDEGVYASNLFFGPPEYTYPLQRFYAPPLLPALIEAFMIVGLPPNVAALLPSFLAGCGTIAALWWFGRSWFGPQVGICAATLAALSDFHVVFSATALTDVLLGLWLVLAVDAIGRSLCGSDLRWAIGAGLYTGVAWWTKYNGWLPLAIEGAALPVLWLFLRPPRKQLIAWLACFAVTAAVGVAIWTPYYLSLQPSGGYGPIAANHAKYVVGFAGWLNSAGRQVANQYAFGIWLSMLGLVLALLLPSFLEPRLAGEALRQIWKSLRTAIGFIFVTWMNAVAFGAALGIVRMVIACRRGSMLDAAWRQRAVGLSLVIAWWSGMVVTTPFYTPYARLTLPCWLAACLAASLNWSDCLSLENEQALSKTLVGGALLPIFLCGLLASGTVLPHPDVWKLPMDRRSLQAIANAIRRTEVRGELRAIYVFGEPAMYFQLRAAGEEIVAPIQKVPGTPAMIDGRPAPTFLATGPHSQRDPQFLEQWAAAKEQWELVQSYDYRPSALVWLDLHDPRQALPAATSLNQVRLYRLRAADGGP